MNAYRSVVAAPADRGVGLGRAQSDAVAATLRVYRRMFAEDVGFGDADVERLGRAVGDRVAAFRPALVDEIEGIAVGAGQPVEWLLAANARTELLAGGAVAGAESAAGSGAPPGPGRTRSAGVDAARPNPARIPSECSVAGRADASGLVLGQTWDFHPDLAAARLLWTVEQADGSWWVTFTEAGVLAKIGMNSRGVALAINFLSSPADGGVDGVPVHVLARCVLEECGSMEDVEALLRATPRSASLCATVATRHDRRLAAFELSPDAVVRREPDVAGRLAHTNHFLDDVPETANGRNSVRRLEQLDAGLAAAAPVSALLSDAGDVDDPIFRFEDPSVPWLTRCATLATLAFDVEAGRMWIRDALDPSVELAEVELTA